MLSQLRLNEPLAQYTSWHIGGVAERYYRPYSLEDLRQFLRTLSPHEPLTWLGLGSNVLIRDRVPGTVIHLLSFPNSQENLPNPLASIEMKDGIVRAGAAVTCAKLAKFCAKHNLQKGEFFAGIPGTVGGALAMNAGAFGGETWSFVKQVEVITRTGDIIERPAFDYQVSYRSVQGPLEEWFLAAYFCFPVGQKEANQHSIQELLRKRSETQPIGSLSCGSVFKNPPNDYAARLIEASGLKGYRIGDAEVSRKHANFIINVGKANAAEVEALIAYIRNKVEVDHQVQLQLEVRLIGK